MSQFTKWADELQGVLERAEAAARQDDIDVRLAAMRSLSQFIIASSPNTPDILELDRIAERARQGLVLDTIAKRVADISARSGELISARKRFGGLTPANSERARRTVEVLTGAAASLEDLVDALTSAQREKLGAEMAAGIAQIRKLRNELERLG